MSEEEHHGGWLVLLTLLLAAFLAIIPMPAQVEDFRPQWVVLVTIFWCLCTPDRFGVFAAFLVGIFLDVVSGTLLGQHALALSVIAYVVIELHQRIRIFPLWQQTLFVWVLLLLDRLLTLWVMSATGQPMPTLLYWAPTFLGLLLWPWLSVSLMDLARRAGTI